MRDGDDRAIEIRSDHLSTQWGCVKWIDAEADTQDIWRTRFTAVSTIFNPLVSTSSLLKRLIGLCIQSTGCLCSRNNLMPSWCPAKQCICELSPHQEAANHQTPGTQSHSTIPADSIFQVFLDFVSPAVVRSKPLHRLKWHELLHHNKKVCHNVMQHPAAAARHGRGKGVAVRPRSSCRRLLRPVCFFVWRTCKNTLRIFLA